MSPDEYRALAIKAKRDAEEYRATALTAVEPRRSVLLKWAKSRDEDSAFYLSRIEILHTCKAEGCDKDVNTKGYCRTHYLRFLKYGDPLLGRSSPGRAERFLQKAISSCTDECIDWPYPTVGGGYGVVNVGDGLRLSAHRFACESVHGPAPSPEHQAAHSCGRGADGCVNPRHLRWATPAENTADKFVHGTVPRGENVGSAKLTAQDVVEIRRLRSSGLSAKDVGDRFNVTRKQIWRITRNENWGHI